jgi:hypothetical protein
VAFVVVYDTNVPYPSTLRDLLIRVAQAGLVQAKWTDQILDEAFDSLTSNRPDLSTEALKRTRELMVAAVRDCLIRGYEPLIDARSPYPILTTGTYSPPPSEPAPSSSSPPTSTTSQAPPCGAGTSSPNTPTNSSSTRSTSTVKPPTAPSSAPPTPGATHQAQSPTSSAGSNEPASSNPSPPSRLTRRTGPKRRHDAVHNEDHHTYQ